MDLFALLLLIQLQQPAFGCTEIDKMLAHLLAKYGESPSGQAQIASSGRGIIFTKNQENDEGSIIVQHPNDPSKWCIAFGLKNFRPVPLPKPGKPT